MFPWATTPFVSQGVPPRIRRVVLTRLLSLITGELIDWQRDAFEDAFTDQILVDEALEFAGHDRAAELQESADDHEPVAGPYHAAEADFFQAPETDHAGHELVLLAVVSGQLGGRFAHDDPRHQRHARHVSPGPELVRPQVLIPHYDVSLVVLITDRRELLHLVPLRVVPADLLDVGNHVLQIVLGEIQDRRVLRPT